MAQNNKWQVEGILSKFEPREGVSKAGNPYMIHSISVYVGKDKETGKSKYENIKFFVPKDDIQAFKSMPGGTILQLRGKPEANAYIDKEGELKKELQIKLDWENSWNVIEREGNPVTKQQEFSEEPF